MASLHAAPSMRGATPVARARLLTQSIQLEEQEVPGVVSRGILLTALLLVGGIVWAHLTPIAEVARTRGAIMPAGRVHQIQHLEGGIVDRIHVNDGDRVEAGQVLVDLRTASAASEHSQMASREAVLAARQWRLALLLGDRLGTEPPPGLHFDEAQDRLLHEQQLAFAEQLAVFDAQRRQRQGELDARRGQSAVLTEQVRLMEERDDIQSDGAGRQLLPRVTMLDARAELARARSELGAVETQMRLADEAMREIAQRRREFEVSWRQDLRLEAERVAAELAEVREERRRVRDRLDRLSIVAPVNGIVQALAVNTLNAVIAPGEVLMEIVPVDDELVAETRVLPNDIGHVRPGQEVDIKVGSFEPQRFGTIRGSLLKVSATTYLDESLAPYYKAEIALSRAYVGSDPQHNRLIPGMTVQADVVTGRKTILDYILKPVYRGFSAAMRER